jgi:multiple sugar transport system substrate-binding protein
MGTQMRARRTFLRGSAAAFLGMAGTALLAACGAAGTTPAAAVSTASTGTTATTATSRAVTSSTSSAVSSATTVASSSTARSVASTTATATGSATKAPATNGITLIAVVRASVNEEKILNEAFSAFEASQPGVTVEVIEAPSGHYDEKTDALLAGGTPPALWFPAENRGYRYYASRNVLMPLDPYIGRDKYDLSDFFPVAIDFCKWQGKYVAMPIDLYPQFLIYNKTLFQDIGLTAPTSDFADTTWNWNAFLNVCTKLTRNPGQSTAQYGSTRAWSDLRTYSWVYGGDWFEPAAYTSGYPKQFPIDADAAIAGMQFDVDCTYKYHAQPTADEAKALRGSLPSDFHTGRYGMYSASFVPFQSFGTITSFAWGVAAMPAPPNLPRRSTLYPDQWATFNGQQHADQAWQLISYMVSPAGLKVYPTKTGALPSRRSVTADWKQIVQGYTKLTDADLNTAIGAADHVQVVPSHALVNFGDIYSKGMADTLGKLTANSISASTALATMTPVVQNLMTSTAAG